MSDDIKTFLVVFAALAAFGLLLKIGEDWPIIEMIHEGYGG